MVDVAVIESPVEASSIVSIPSEVSVVNSYAGGVIYAGEVQQPTALRLPAAANLSGHRALIYSGGLANYADNLTADHAYLVIGISQSSVVSGALVDVYNRVLVTESGWSWAVGQPVFCGVNGLLTQTPPTSPAKFLLVVGTAFTPNQLSVDIQEPIFL